MTEKEIGQVLAVLKVAYPQQLNKLNKDEAVATMKLWQTQFANIPYDILMLAVQRYIAEHEFFPSIKEMRDEIRKLHCQAEWALQQHKQEIEYGIGARLSDEVHKQVEYIATTTDDCKAFGAQNNLLDLLGTHYDPQQGQMVGGNKLLTNHCQECESLRQKKEIDSPQKWG